MACASSNGCVEIALKSLSVFIASSGIRTEYPAIQVQGSVLSVIDCTFSGCYSSADGSCVQSYDLALVQIKSSRFLDSNSSGYGGAISSAGSQLYLERCVFYNCQSDLGGGAVWVSTFYLFGSNTIVDTNVYVDESEFGSCASLGNGGAILISDASDLYESIEIWIRSTNFFQCSSAVNGGAISLSGGTVTAKVFNSTFSQCISSECGAVSADSSANLISFDSRFDNNIAFGMGGGAICSTDAYVFLENVSFLTNSAPNGGGGILLLQGLSMIMMSENEVSYHPRAPVYDMDLHDAAYTSTADAYIDLIFERIEAVRLNSSICTNELGNYAVYGPCVASTYYRLDVQGLPVPEDPISPGLPFSVTVLKKDIYNQTILSDSSSLLQMMSSMGTTIRNDAAISISGDFISVLQNGSAEFTVVLSPSYSKVSFVDEKTVLLRIPYVYFKGIDADSISTTMETEPAEVFMANGSKVCPSGYILVLDKSRKGSCTECEAGTYSVNPLAGNTFTRPSCFTCPIDGSCDGGDNVQLPLGIWIVSAGFYKLIGCPEGYQLIDSNAIGLFSRDTQTCHQCSSTQYIINSNMSNISCQPCPKGKGA